MKRKIIKINEDLCNGCGQCIPDCPEGALKLIDGKARLVSDLFCDGLGACIGHCPVNAISVEEREAEPYNEALVMKEQIIPKGINVIREHLAHLHNHAETAFLNQAIEILQQQGIAVPDYIEMQSKGCPGCSEHDLSYKDKDKATEQTEAIKQKSELRQWPIQLHLINPSASYFDNCDLLISADCVPYSYGSFHQDFIKDKKVVTFCPKLDHSNDRYIDKLTELFKNNKIHSVNVVIMEVPCCGGTGYITQEAIKNSGKNIIYKETVIGIDGSILAEK
ncbi:MAG: 4Fe-4S binding protein [Spirochaetes bacterium]|nr:4Fe-4S binding protein [Spirochaetota bacterium]MBN2770294.1 4Fe-4S binding protein [Spirochaetota bacterium]